MKNSSSPNRLAQPPTGRRRRWTAAGLALVLLGALLASVSCRKPGTDLTPADVDYNTCTMHPSVRQQSPKDKCPICGMDLVPVKKKGAPADHDHGQMKGDAKSMGMSPEEHAKMSGGKDKQDMKGMQGMGGMKDMKGMPGMQKEEMKEDEPSEFMVPVSRQQQIGVTYAVATNKPLQLSVRTVGIVAFDRVRHWDIVTRVDGYVDKLFVSSKGELVEKGQPVVTIYSPDLLTTQREFLDLLRARDEAKSSASAAVGESLDKLIEAAKGRLRLWSITDAQIQDLERERKPNVYLTLFAPVRGLVQNIEVSQGQ